MKVFILSALALFAVRLPAAETEKPTWPNTVAKYLQAVGYHTGMVGKWHLGSKQTGFDQWIILPGQGSYTDPSFLKPEGRTKKTGYVTDIITDLSIEVLEKRPKDKPFFLMCHHKAPHRPSQPDEKHKAQFADKVIPEPATLRDDYAGRTDAIRECKQKVLEIFITKPRRPRLWPS